MRWGWGRTRAARGRRWRRPSGLAPHLLSSESAQRVHFRRTSGVPACRCHAPRPPLRLTPPRRAPRPPAQDEASSHGRRKASLPPPLAHPPSPQPRAARAREGGRDWRAHGWVSAPGRPAVHGDGPRGAQGGPVRSHPRPPFSGGPAMPAGPAADSRAPGARGGGGAPSGQPHGLSGAEAAQAVAQAQGRCDHARAGAVGGRRRDGAAQRARGSVRVGATQPGAQPEQRA